MEEKSIDCVVDRIEGGVAVLVPDDGSQVLEADVSVFPFLRENMGCTATFRDGKLAEIRERSVTTDNRSRLQSLFNKNK